jgi:hypothetical protein
LILDTSLVSGYNVIPALEQVVLSINITLVNLYNEDLTNPSYVVWVASGMQTLFYFVLFIFILIFPTGVSVQSLPTGCKIVNTTTATPPNSALDSTYYLDCTASATSFPAFTKELREIQLKIEDVSITLKQVLKI